MKKFILYERKSKDRTDKDGNVVANQHTFATQEWMVSNYLTSLGEEGVDWIIVERFAETMSGAGHYSKRPLFSQAVSMCKEDQSLTLLCSKAERLARDVWSGAELMKTINFTLANAPDADDLQKHIEFVIAEREWKNTSQRFKDMLAAKKSRGEGIGAAAEGYKRSSTTCTVRNKEDAKRRTESLIQPLKCLISAMTKVTYKTLAQALTAGSYPLPSGVIGTWNPSQVQRVMTRFDLTLH